jgi:hypothetical protein
MVKEIKSIEDNNTWCLVILPSGHCPIGLKWVYKVKKGPEGEIVKHKARLVTKGYVQLGLTLMRYSLMWRVSR